MTQVKAFIPIGIYTCIDTSPEGIIMALSVRRRDEKIPQAHVHGTVFFNL